MTEPTSAQIEAAAKAIYVSIVGIDDCWAEIIWAKANQEKYRTIARAALIAAQGEKE